MTDTDDRHLLLATHAGDEPAARAFWARHAPRLIAYAAAILPPGFSGEDAVQAAMCTLLKQSRKSLARVENVPAWLAHLVRNTALNSLRADRRERARLRGMPGSPARAGRPPTDAAGPVDELRRAVDALPRRLREVIFLKHVAGLTFDEMALALDANRNTVAARYRAALTKVRETLSDDGIPVPLKCRAETAEVSHGS